MSSKTFKTTIVREPVPFDPAPVFGRVRTPVKVTLNGYTYRSTIFSMEGMVGIPLRKSNREAAGLEGGETLDVRLELDDEKREVELPADFAKALRAAAPAWDRRQELSFTHQREYAEALADAQKPETRARRIETSVKAIAARPAKKRPR